MHILKRKRSWGIRRVLFFALLFLLMPSTLLLAQDDSDSDGYTNDVDYCPYAGDNGQGVDEFGCPVGDWDGDGFLDDFDYCPYRGDEGAGIDEYGCPPSAYEADADSDGVPDSFDFCPTQGDEGAGIDEYGCPLGDAGSSPPSVQDQAAPANNVAATFATEIVCDGQTPVFTLSAPNGAAANTYIITYEDMDGGFYEDYLPTLYAEFYLEIPVTVSFDISINGQLLASADADTCRSNAPATNNNNAAATLSTEVVCDGTTTTLVVSAPDGLAAGSVLYTYRAADGSFVEDYLPALAPQDSLTLPAIVNFDFSLDGQLVAAVSADTCRSSAPVATDSSQVNPPDTGAAPTTPAQLSVSMRCIDGSPVLFITNSGGPASEGEFRLSVEGIGLRNVPVPALDSNQTLTLVLTMDSAVSINGQQLGQYQVNACDPNSQSGTNNNNNAGAPLPPQQPPAPSNPAAGNEACAEFAGHAQTMLTLVNDARAQAGAPPLALDPALNAAACRHTLDMVNNNTFGHTGSDGSSMGQRIRAAGYVGVTAGENVAAGSPDPQVSFNQWMNSEGHRRNILNPEFRFMGLSHVYSANTDYGHYWTQTFGG
ncbi:CAP domain-containing protein [bacterium]|nr:CAP domain-containing protein [bacterium]